MSAYSVKQPQFVITQYYGFLVDKLNLIYYRWAEGEDVEALSLAYKLTAFLVPELKGKMKERVKAIEEGYRKCLSRRGFGVYGQSRSQNRCMKQVANEHLKPFLDSLMEELQERGYLEKKKPDVPVGSE